MASAASWNEEEETSLELVRSFPGRVALVEADGTLHIGRNYDVLRSTDAGVTWEHVTRFPRSPLRRAAEVSRLACRLLRQEVRALLRLSGGEYVAANREGVFYGVAGDHVFRAAAVEEGALPLRPPMRLCVGPDDTVLFGEYGSSKAGKDVRLFGSRDGGAGYELVHTFPAGEIGHVHNIVYDASEGHYWVMVGDHGPHAGIGKLSADLQRFEWFVRGDQSFRAVEVFDLGGYLLYANDTEVERNGLIELDKKTGAARRIREFDGSCIYACRFGGLYAFSTSVEPSEVNLSKFGSLWLSRDGYDWRRAFRARKDRWSARYFQFGSIVLPAGASNDETIYFSGQALSSIDGRTYVARLTPEAGL